MERSADIAAVLDEHMAAEFAQRDLDAAMATMTDDPCVYQVPVMTGDVGFEGVRSFYLDLALSTAPRLDRGAETSA